MRGRSRTGIPLRGPRKPAKGRSRVSWSPRRPRSDKAPQRPGKRDFAQRGLRRASRPGSSPFLPPPEHPAWRARIGPAAGEGGRVWLKKGGRLSGWRRRVRLSGCGCLAGNAKCLQTQFSGHVLRCASQPLIEPCDPMRYGDRSSNGGSHAV